MNSKSSESSESITACTLISWSPVSRYPSRGLRLDSHTSALAGSHATSRSADCRTDRRSETAGSFGYNAGGLGWRVWPHAVSQKTGVGTADGRDHHPFAFSAWLAGGVDR